MGLQLFKNIILRESLYTTFLNTVGRGIGFIIPIFIADWFGLAADTDVFFFVYGAILYLTDIFAQSLESNIIPFVAKLRQTQHENLSLFINKLLFFVSCSMLVIIAVFLVFAKPVFGLITHFSPSSQDLMFRLLAATCPLLLLITLSGILSGVLNSYFKFWLPAISPGIRAVICIAVIFLLKDKFGIYAVALGYILGEIARLFIFILAILKYKLVALRLDCNFDIRVISFFKTLSFQMAAMTAASLNPIIDKAMASWLAVGSISVLQYADRLYFIPVTFITSGVLMVLFSRWSDNYHSRGRLEVLNEDIKKGILIIGVIGIFLTVLFAIFSRQLVGLAYGRGKFPLEMLGPVNLTFICYLSGITFYLIRQLVVKAHLILHDTRVLMNAAIISNILNVGLNIFLMRFFGVAGIALSTTIVSALIFFYLYHKFSIRVKNVI